MLLYNEAARILKLVEDKKGSVKNLTFSSAYQNKGQLFALVCETLKYDAVLGQILSTSKLQQLERSLRDACLAKCLLHDFLFGRGLKVAGKYQEVIGRHSAALNACLARIKVRAKVASNKDLIRGPTETSVRLPRYVRVNTIKTTVGDVMKRFREEGYKPVSTDGLDYDGYLALLRRLKGKQFAVDIHIAELLVFPSGTDLHLHPLYLLGNIIFQDKASCLPAIVLAPRAGSQIIDCCAAPGNKTTLLAALIGNKGRIYAYDMDESRVATLSLLLKRAGALCVTATHADFLRVDPRGLTHRDVEFILVDPSCSGSGIVNRVATSLDKVTDPSPDPARLRSLASFQTRLLLHALSFPRARRVVYSTCSVHRAENESVVADVLRKSADWTLVDALPEFSARGVVEGAEGRFAEAVKCVRMGPAESLTNGFFVACFERRIVGGGDGLVVDGDEIMSDDGVRTSDCRDGVASDFTGQEMNSEQSQLDAQCEKAGAACVARIAVKAKNRKRGAAEAGVDETVRKNTGQALTDDIDPHDANGSEKPKRKRKRTMTRVKGADNVCVIAVNTDCVVGPATQAAQLKVTDLDDNTVKISVRNLVIPSKHVRTTESSKVLDVNSKETDSSVKACHKGAKQKRGKNRRRCIKPITACRNYDRHEAMKNKK